MKGSRINSVIDVGKGLNFLHHQVKNKKNKSTMKKLSSYKLELKDTEKEKRSLTTPSRFKDYKLSKKQEISLETQINN